MVDLCQVEDLMMKTLERGPESPVCHKPTVLYRDHPPSPSEFCTQRTDTGSSLACSFSGPIILGLHPLTVPAKCADKP